MNTNIMNSIKLPPMRQWALLWQRFLISTYFGPTQQLWQVVVVNQKEVAAVHTLWEQNKCGPCPSLTSLPAPHTVDNKSEQAERKPEAAALTTQMLAAALTHSLVSHCHIL